MKFLTTLMAAAMVVGMATPALADYDYDDYREDIRDANKDYAKAVRKQQRHAYRSYRNGYYGAPGYYSNRAYYPQVYPSSYYYGRGRHSGIARGILDAIF